MATQAELADALARAQVAKDGEKSTTSIGTAAVEKPSQLTIHGRAGLNYNIEGKGFGTVKGQVLISGRAVDVTAWTDTKVKGPLPVDLKPGPVSVRAGEQEFVGYFGKR